MMVVLDKDTKFAKALVLLATEHKIGSFSVTYGFGYRAPFNPEIWGKRTFNWKEPGHSSESHVQIVTEARYNVDVTEEASLEDE